ncbi:MAG: 3-hydroxyacyl-CoA dehydrogenase family protein [Peptococcaceae bacterium]|nr:3-hydroxyacyl-CoA dehydrogenase family protein [Peptococcaceae bacterium]
MAPEDIKKIAVIGSGLMGHGIGLTYALAGYSVALNDVSDAILDNAVDHIRHNLETFHENQLIKKEQIGETLSRISTTTDLEKAVRDADFVTEAIVEDTGAKKKLFHTLDALCPPRTILASNTSSLLISEFGSGTKREDRQVITHWFNPPHIVPVVEIVRGPKTSDETVDITYALLKKAGKFPVRVLKEIPGFLVNRVQSAAIREVWSLWEQGVASVEDIDLAIRGSFGFRLASLGPLQICDLGGLDLWYRVGQNLMKVIDRSTEPSPAVKEKVERGELGLKTGKGFYTYDSDYSKAGWDQVVKKRDREFIQRLKNLYWNNQEG